LMYSVSLRTPVLPGNKSECTIWTVVEFYDEKKGLRDLLKYKNYRYQVIVVLVCCLICLNIVRS
jgi:hypothetical protein